jgi:hypothetical protein
MAERRKVYISIGEFQYNKKYQIPYIGYVIGLGYAYVTRAPATVPYCKDLTAQPLFTTRMPEFFARDTFSYEIILEQRLDLSKEALNESVPDIAKNTGPLISATLLKEAWFFISHLAAGAGYDIGYYKYGTNNISTVATRFATRKYILKEQPASFEGEGTEVNAFRHVLWQSYITNKYGYDMALQAGNAHEKNPDADITQRRFKSLKEADQIIDLLNNRLGRRIGETANKNTVMNTMAIMVLDAFYKDGFYTAREEKSADGKVLSYYIDRTTITEEQYQQLKEFYGKLNQYARTAEEQEKKDWEDKEKLESLQRTWGTMK